MSLAFKKHQDKTGVADDEARRFVETDFSKSKSLTVQSPTEEVDINKIVARALKGQSVPIMNGQPFYGDVSEFGDLQQSLIKVQEAEDLFMQYPADVREKFENDPVKMIEFLSNEKNRDEAEKLGLVNKRPAPEPTQTPPPVPAPEGGKTQLPS